MFSNPSSEPPGPVKGRLRVAVAAAACVATLASLGLAEGAVAQGRACEPGWTALLPWGPGGCDAAR